VRNESWSLRHFCPALNRGSVLDNYARKGSRRKERSKIVFAGDMRIPKRLLKMI
jgi:hypothetical protein